MSTTELLPGPMDLMAVYVTVRDGESARTDELVSGVVFADYNERGELLGIEILEPRAVNATVKIK